MQLDSFSLGRGTQKITGNLTYNSGLENLGCSGAFYYTTYPTGNTNGHSGAYGTNGRNISLQASKTWIGMSTSAAPYTQNMGESTPFNNMPPYLVVNIWKRLS